MKIVIKICDCVMTVLCCFVWLGVQDRAQAYRDEEVKTAFTNINLQHAQMQKSQASYEMRQHEPTTRVESEVHVERAKYMLNMLEEYKPDEARVPSALSQQGRREPPTFTKPLLNSTVAKEGHPIKYVMQL